MTSLFQYEGRLNRARFWLGHLVLLGLAIVGVVLLSLIAGLAASTKSEKGDVSALGILAFLACAIAGFGGLGALIWSGVCLGIRRYHDRDKPGIWVAIQFVPFIGGFWYLIETGFLPGTLGPNQYGPDPLDPAATAFVASTAVPGTSTVPAIGPMRRTGRPGWLLTVMFVLALPSAAMVLGGLAWADTSRRWLAGAIHVTGHVVDLVPVEATDGSSKTRYKAVVAAMTPDGTPFQITESWAITPAPTIGETRDLIYDSTGPLHAKQASFVELYLGPALLGGAGAVILVFWLCLTLLVAVLWKPRGAYPSTPERLDA